MRHALLTAIGIVVAAAWVWLLAGPKEPWTTLARSPAPIPFGAHLSGWIDDGVPIGAVAELEGRQFLILVGENEDQSWSVAIDPGETPRAANVPAPVALGPFDSRKRR